ncbi:MAG: flavin reductase [Marmoricola sp.]|jgi:flavin reductase (DIM6/NTAB) family NADH-FMN oxidoreductase RutF|nr:flavin reductase [Marmoricola sp.]
MVTPAPKDLKKSCMGIFGATPAPVAMVTLHVEGRPWGVTVSSVIPITMDPPKILVSLFGDSIAARQILQNGVFGVSLLTTGHQFVARAQARPKMPKFLDGDPHQDDLIQGPVAHRATRALVDRPPRISRAAHLDCEVVSNWVVDDHVLLVGQVTDVHEPETGAERLLYVTGRFAQALLLGAEPPIQNV